MNVFAMVLCFVALLAAAPALNVSPFADRIAALQLRLTSDASQLSSAQKALLHAEVDDAQRAETRGDDAQAQAMLDIIDRQVSAVDHTLSRPESGGVLVVHVGDDVTIAMRDGFTYAVAISDPSAFSVHVGVMWARGVQGVYNAKRPATINVTLTPNEPGGKPATFTIVILPAASGK